MSRTFPLARRWSRQRGLLRYAAPALLLAATSLSVTPAADALPGPQASPRAAAPSGTVELRDAGDGTRAADVPLAPTELVGVKRGWRTQPITTTGFSMVGLTWNRTDQAAPGVHVRVRSGEGAWGAWQKMDRQEDVPGVSEGGTRDGTHPVWTGEATELQLALVGRRPAGMTLAIIEPARRAADRTIAPTTTKTIVKPTTAPEPAIVQRSDWGADPSWRNGSPTYNWTIKQVQVHHTAGSNNYAKEDVPAVMRGIYRYHTHNLGWFDVGYNFLVDKWGRIWVGRSGGLRQPVRGAHTLGFNHMSVGISVIGNYQSTAVPREVIRSIIELSAWKLDPYKRNPEGTIKVESRGSDKYPAGRVMTFPVIQGHRDTNDTACPGAKLYEQLDFIRWRSAQRVRNFS